ncbi:MAG: hypothetical protein DIZ80_06485 [endosymbiont of Galathealinum brachiosum]|uniref:Sulfotransferase domain-containing protein n=1 Tax=endosymbiont of Galathealinum brachiosum TaxID=2200906 RepID=A0A370DFX1_9GAMM|nr:MAG: hypothetical protein DIZ80_06485 [endosymbiont of Galathealinum brachiosum]
MINIKNLKLSWYSSYKVNKLREMILSILSITKITKVIFIFGCQRSGTTIIQNIISLDPSVKYHGEGDEPYFYDVSTEKHHRLKPQQDVDRILNNELFNYMAIKPLYESQHANNLLKQYSNSKSVWMFRHYQDVIDSHLHYYKYNSHDYIKPFFDKNIKNWLNESIPKDINEFIQQFKLEELSDADAYGLFWIVRNSIYWDIKDNKNVILINYEKLVSQPDVEISKTCKFLNLPYYSFYCNAIRSNAVSKKVNFTLQDSIKEKCEDIYNRLIEKS